MQLEKTDSSHSIFSEVRIPFFGLKWPLSATVYINVATYFER